MTLALEIKARGHNRWTVALSLANNRRSKIELLLRDDSSRCRRMAARNSDALVRDVAAFLAKHKHTAEQARRLHVTATTMRLDLI